MKRNSAARLYKPFVNFGILMAQVTGATRGFQLRDVSFYCDLLFNWLEVTKASPELGIQIVQIQRCIKALVDRGGVQLAGGGYRKRFALNRQGVLDLLEDVVLTKDPLPMDQITLVAYILKEYGPLIMNGLISGESFTTKRQERYVSQLLAADEFVVGQLNRLREVERDLSTRLDESWEIVAYTGAEITKGRDPLEVALSLDSRFTYQLAHQRSFAEVFSSMPEPLLKREIVDGISGRNRLLFQPLLRQVRSQVDSLESLLAVLKA